MPEMRFSKSKFGSLLKMVGSQNEEERHSFSDKLVRYCDIVGVSFTGGLERAFGTIHDDSDELDDLMKLEALKKTVASLRQQVSTFGAIKDQLTAQLIEKDGALAEAQHQLVAAFECFENEMGWQLYIAKHLCVGCFWTRVLTICFIGGYVADRLFGNPLFSIRNLEILSWCLSPVLIGSSAPCLLLLAD